jgi:outer membrane protein assembly factor BamB
LDVWATGLVYPTFDLLEESAMPLRPLAFCALAFVIASAGLSGQGAAPRPGTDWPSFRGHRATGIAEGFRLPAAWDVAAGTGIRWKTPLEGLGHASPVIWRDRIYLTTSISGKTDAALRPGYYGNIDSVADDTVHTWKLVALDKKTGKVAFERTMLTGVPKIKRHLKSTHANTTLATDGTHLVAMLGSEGLHVFDMQGRVLWKKDFGVLDSGYFAVPAAQWEFSSSPIIHNGVVIVLADVQKDSFLAAFDVRTGKELWRTPRADVPTFGTPTVHEVTGRTLVFVNGWKHTGAYDFKTGAEVWKLAATGDIPTPTPIAAHGLVYFTSAHGPGSPVYAIKETATGDISLAAGTTSNTHIAWSVPRSGAYMSTPIVYGDVLYVCRWNGILLAFDARSGEQLYEQRLGAGAFTASIVGGDGKLYIANEDGEVFIVKPGRTYELAGKQTLGENVFATPAISEGVIYFRTAKNLIAIGN